MASQLGNELTLYSYFYRFSAFQFWRCSGFVMVGYPREKKMLCMDKSYAI